jgi:cation diffusion facilitator CzcD-associated flavoprotein CzcO
MLQRSPSYIVAIPDQDPLADALGRRLPARAAYPVVRWKNVALTTLIYRACRRWPRLMRRFIRWGVKRQLPEGYDVDTHFKPQYDPWDQRMCLVPNGDLFQAIREGRASVATDHIETFTETGIKLRSGAELEADVVVTATGLNMLAMGGMDLVVDGEAVELPKTMAYKSMMLSGVPNFAYALGYTNASWTLKADLTSEYVCRLLNYMDAHGHRACVPERDPSVAEQPFLDFQAGYVLRSVDQFPKQGSRAPWRVHQNYARDLVALRYGSVAESMRFIAPARVAEPVAA